MRNSILSLVAAAALGLAACDRQPEPGDDTIQPAPGSEAPGTATPGPDELDAESPAGPGALGTTGPGTGQDTIVPPDSLDP